MPQQRLPVLRRRLEIPIDVLDHDHRGIDDDAEIDGADRKQIGVLAAQHQDDDAEEQRERDVGADDDGAAQIAEKDPLNEENQHAAENQIMQHRAGGDVDQLSAIVERHQPDAGRQAAVAVDLGDLGADARDHVVSVQGPIHDDDRLDHVIFTITTGLAEARYVTHRNLGDVFDEDRHAVLLQQHDVLDVLELIALGHIVGAAVIHQADAADVHRLLAEIDGAPADIDVGVAERGDHLRQGDVVGIKLMQIDIDVEFLGGAAPSVQCHDAGNGQ